MWDALCDAARAGWLSAQAYAHGLASHERAVHARAAAAALVDANLRWTTVNAEPWIALRVSTAEHAYAYLFLFCCLCTLVAPLFTRLLSLLVWEALVPYGPGKGGWLVRHALRAPLWALQQLTAFFATALFVGLLAGAAYALRAAPGPEALLGMLAKT